MTGVQTCALPICGIRSLGLGLSLLEVELGGGESELGAEGLDVGSLELVADVGSVDTEGASLGFVGELSAVNTELGLGSPDTKLGAGSSNLVVDLWLSVSEGTVGGLVGVGVSFTVTTVGFAVTLILDTVGSLLLVGSVETVRVLATVRVLDTVGFLTVGVLTVRVLTVSTEGFATEGLFTDSGTEVVLSESGADVSTEGRNASTELGTVGVVTVSTEGFAAEGFLLNTVRVLTVRVLTVGVLTVRVLDTVGSVVLTGVKIALTVRVVTVGSVLTVLEIATEVTLSVESGGVEAGLLAIGVLAVTDSNFLIVRFDVLSGILEVESLVDLVMVLEILGLVFEITISIEIVVVLEILCLILGLTLELEVGGGGVDGTVDTVSLGVAVAFGAAIAVLLAVASVTGGGSGGNSTAMAAPKATATP